MRWPSATTQWLDGLQVAQQLAGGELLGTGERLGQLQALATSNPSPVGVVAEAAAALGREAMNATLGQQLTCLAVTPFQPGIGQGGSQQRFLSAPNLLGVLGDKLLQLGQAEGNLHALALLFLGTRYDQLSMTLERFNNLLPVPELQRTQRRAQHLARLEQEKWHLPIASPLPRWQSLDLSHCTITRATRQALSGQLAVLEGYREDKPPMDELKALAQKKQALQAGKDQQLEDLRRQLADGSTDGTMQARLVGPGNVTELRRQLLQGEAPGHEWVLCAGLLLVAPLDGLSFVLELVGLDP